MYKEYADYALKLLKKRGVQYGEVRLEQHEGSGMVLKNGGPELSGFNTSVGMGVRFLVKNALGFISINNFQKENIKDNIERGLKLVGKGSELSDNIGLSKERVHKKKYRVLQKIKLRDVEPGRVLKLLKETDGGMKRGVGRYLSLQTDVGKEYFINTEGSKIEAEIPSARFLGMIILKVGERSGQKLYQCCNSGGYEFVKKWDLPKVMLKEYKAIENNLKKAVKTPKGKMEVVVGPEVTGIMVHESCGHPMEADRILGREAAQAGESFIHRGMVGGRMGNKRINIVDDPTLKNSAGFYLYDDEGVRARRKYLYKEGRINDFLHNRETAAEMGLKSNGSSRAEDFDKEAMVRMSNTFLLPGDCKEEELIKGVKRGVYMRDFTEWNIDDKRFQMKFVGSDAWLIERGKLKEPVFRPVLELTTPKLWGSVDMIGKKVELSNAICGKGEPIQGVPVSLGGPAMKLKGISLG